MKEEYLKKWVITYLKSKGAIDKKIKEIKEEKNKAVVTYEENETIVIAMEKLSLDEIPEADKIIIITFKTRDNLKILTKEWKKAANIKGLNIYFLNPNSEEEMWAINPYLHNRICVESALEQGLKAMFDNVGEISGFEVADIAPEDI